MTNEEKALTLAARKVVGHYLLDVGAEKIDAALLELQLAVQDFEKAKEASSDAVREAKIEAYEEAAREAKAYSDDARKRFDSEDEAADLECVGAANAGEVIEGRIRALKDSLAQQPVEL